MEDKLSITLLNTQGKILNALWNESIPGYPEIFKNGNIEECWIYES